MYSPLALKNHVWATHALLALGFVFPTLQIRQATADKMLSTYNENNVQCNRRMRANPGGTIGLTEIVGRDNLVQELWQILQGQSLVLTSERRVGKTCVIRKMKEECPDPSVVCVLRDLEELCSPQEFVEALYGDVENLLPLGDRARLKIQQLLSKLGGVEVHDIKLPKLTPHWKNLLFALMEDVFENNDWMIVFFGMNFRSLSTI